MIEEIFEYCERTYLSKSVGNTKLIYFSSLISKWYLMVEAKIITLMYNICRGNISDYHFIIRRRLKRHKGR